MTIIFFKAGGIRTCNNLSSCNIGVPAFCLSFSERQKAGTGVVLYSFKWLPVKLRYRPAAAVGRRCNFSLQWALFQRPATKEPPPQCRSREIMRFFFLPFFLPFLPSFFPSFLFRKSQVVIFI